MHVTFLGSRLPLTKTFVFSEGIIASTPYPHVSKVTSYHEQAKDLVQFKNLLDAHAAQHHCLFNGHLKTPLKNESRAGQTNPKPREWLVFDFDKVEAKDHAEVVATYLPKECQNVSYIAQLSASMFRPDTALWSGHIFMLLAKPIEAPRLKQWFEHLNFSVPALKEQIRLSDSLQALHWPLDRTVAYDSKLIYIAPPKCHGFEPAISQHITLVKKRHQALAIPEFTPIDNITIRQQINDLRRSQGMDEISYNLTLFEGNEVFSETDVQSIEGIRSSGDHYIRFNLNGGDSYAYFIDLRAPELIRNFKGEPYLKTADAAPDLWKRLRVLAPQAVKKQALDDDTEVLAFYASNQSSSIKYGTYSPGERRLRLNNGPLDAAKAWLDEYGVIRPGRLPHYDLVFDPQSDVQFVSGLTTINTFRATDYMARTKSSDTPSTLKDLPPLANKIIRSITGDAPDNVVTHFVNWLAFIFQKRTRSNTAWVLSGVEGTGKGTFIEHYLRPLLGKEHVVTLTYANLKGEFNAFIENALLVVIEEADTKAADNIEDVMSKLRNWIADEEVSVRKMRTDVYNARNHANFLLNTNKPAPAQVSSTDRRFNFGEWQSQRWFPTPNELAKLKEGAELDDFADMLLRWPVDENAAAMVIDTEAKRNAHEASTSINQLIAEAILKGDLQFFIDRMPSDAEAAADFFNRFNPIGTFKSQVDSYIEAAMDGRTLILGDEDLFFLFRTLIPDTRYFQDSKTWRKRHFKSLGLDTDKQHRLPGSWNKRERGVKVQWQPPADVPDTHKSDDGKVTSIKKRAKK